MTTAVLCSRNQEEQVTLQRDLKTIAREEAISISATWYPHFKGTDLGDHYESLESGVRANVKAQWRQVSSRSSAIAKLLFVAAQS